MNKCVLEHDRQPHSLSYAYPLDNHDEASFFLLIKRCDIYMYDYNIEGFLLNLFSVYVCKAFSVTTLKLVEKLQQNKEIGDVEGFSSQLFDLVRS